ncbi:MAG TPA: hypothetical protein VN231_12965 [Allosphingosinicella sp.]|nr:hypothetical protein [Allosphingosinicella sp.]
MAALDRIDRPYGSGDPDILTAGPVGSRLLGFQGGDVIRGGGSADLLFGLAGNDRIEGGNGADTLHGGSGGDALYGGGANDLLFGDPDAYLLSAGAAVAERTDALIGASSFGIVYFGSSYTLEGLAAAAHDMLIINPARTINTNVARGEELWLANEISAIEGNGKQAIGYISLAKINDFVDYWDPGWTSNGRATGVDTGAPKFLLGLDPEEHDGDFTRLADFGDAGWRALLFDRVETIIDQGFSGLFLDDLMQHYDRHPKDPAKIAEAARDMRDLVIALVDHARDKIRLESGEAAAEAFTIIVNGAPFLIANTTADNSALDAGREAAFYGSIDALLVENYVRIGDGLALAQAVQAYGARGIALLSVDTGQATPQQRAEIEEAAVAAGFLPTVTPTGNYSDLSSRFVPGANLPAAGNDLLDGGTGADQMQGRGGNDSYFVDNVGDRVVEANGAGTDTVNSSVSFSLYGQYIEKLTLTGSAAVNAAGNSLANILTGNSAANVLNGMTGADAMAGGKGDDTYVVDHSGDTVRELAGEGADSVRSSVSFSLAGQYIEKLILTGSAAINGTGNGHANSLTGNGAANLLDGGAAADTLSGGGGADFFLFSSALGGGNVDAILDFSVPADTIRLARSVFTQAGANGTLSAAAFRQGAAAADASDRIVYDSATGRIFYDPDGSGAAAQILFASVTAGTALTQADFVVYG